MGEKSKISSLPRRAVVLSALSYAAGIGIQHTLRNYVSVIIMLGYSAVTLMAVKKIYEMMFLSVEAADDKEADGMQYGFAPQFFKTGAVITAVSMVLGMAVGYADLHRGDDVWVYPQDSISVIEGRVVKAEIKDAESYYLTVRDRKTGEKILVTADAGSIDKSSNNMLQREEKVLKATGYTGCIVKVKGVAEKPSGASNPGGFDYSLYLKSMGIRYIMSADEKDISLCSEAAGMWHILNILGRAKAEFEETVFSRMDPESAGLLCGIMFGDDGLMSEEVQENFRHVGTGHLLAVSGLHVGMVYGVFFVLLGRPRTLGSSIPLVILMLAYAAVSGFSPSVVRAVFMIFVNIVARVTHRRYDFLTCIAFCGGVILMARPAKLFSSGFQLSFLAVITLSVVMSKLERMIDISELPDFETQRVTLISYGYAVLKQRFVQFIILTIALQIGMAPLTIHTFHYFSPAGLLANSPSIALAGIIVPLGMLMMGLAGASTVTAVMMTGNGSGIIGLINGLTSVALKFVSGMTEMLTNALTGLNRIAEEAVSFRYAASPGVAVLVIYYFLLFFFCSETGEEFWKTVRKRSSNINLMIVLLIGIISLGIGIQGALAWEYHLSDAVFADVGQGDCCHIKGGKGVDVLCDSGGSEMKDVGTDVLIPYFLSHGIRNIDLAVISHLHTDHYKGLTTLKDGVKICHLLLSESYKSQSENISRETGVPIENMIFAKAGDVINAGGGITVKVLAPIDTKAGAEDENEASLVFKVEYKGRSILFTGDINSEAEERLAETWQDKELQADILKIPHHGSRFSSNDIFLKAVNPEISVIQVGRNMYGHPTQEAMDRITASGSKIYRNDIHGAVMMDFDGSAFKKNNPVRIWCLKGKH